MDLGKKVASPPTPKLLGRLTGELPHDPQRLGLHHPFCCTAFSRQLIFADAPLLLCSLRLESRDKCCRRNTCSWEERGACPSNSPARSIAIRGTFPRP